MAGATLSQFCVHHTTMHSLHYITLSVSLIDATSVECVQIYMCLTVSVTSHLHFWQNDWDSNCSVSVTSHLHFWQNDSDLLCATVVTQEWNRYRNKGQHKILTLEKKILPLLLLGLEPKTFWSWVNCSIRLSITELSPLQWAEIEREVRMWQ